jgi:hypothetical protein
MNHLSKPRYYIRVFIEQPIVTKLPKKMLLRNLKVHYGLYRTPLLLYIMRQINPIHIVFILGPLK